MSWLAQNWKELITALGVVISLIVSAVALKFSIPGYRLNQRALAYDEALDKFMGELAEQYSYLRQHLSGENNIDLRTEDWGWLLPKLEEEYERQNSIAKTLQNWEHNIARSQSSDHSTSGDQAILIHCFKNIVSYIETTYKRSRTLTYAITGVNYRARFSGSTEGRKESIRRSGEIIGKLWCFSIDENDQNKQLINELTEAWETLVQRQANNKR